MDTLTRFHHTAMSGKVVTRKYFWQFFSCDYDFTIVKGDRVVSGFNDKCKVHTLFIVSKPSTEIQLSIQEAHALVQ